MNNEKNINPISFLNDMEDFANQSVDENQQMVGASPSGKCLNLPNHFTRFMSLLSWSPDIEVDPRSLVMSRREYLVLMYAFNNIKTTNDRFDVIEIPLHELCALLGIQLQGSKDYQEWRKLIDCLGYRRVTYITKSRSYVVCPYFSYCELNAFTNVIRLKLNQELAPYFINLTKNKTIFNFGYLTQLSSAYTMRIYTLCASMRTGGYNFNADVSYLQKIIGHTGKFNDFMRDVLMPNLYEINRISDLHIRLQYVKSGRSVQSIRFFVRGKTEEEQENAGISPFKKKEKRPYVSSTEMRQTLLLPPDAYFDKAKEIYLTEKN